MTTTAVLLHSDCSRWRRRFLRSGTGWASWWITMRTESRIQSCGTLIRDMLTSFSSHVTHHCRMRISTELWDCCGPMHLPVVMEGVRQYFPPSASCLTPVLLTVLTQCFQTKHWHFRPNIRSRLEKSLLLLTFHLSRFVIYSFDNVVFKTLFCRVASREGTSWKTNGSLVVIVLVVPHPLNSMVTLQLISVL